MTVEQNYRAEMLKAMSSSLQSLERQYVLGNNWQPDTNTTTCTSAPEPPSFNIDDFTKTLQEIKGMLPVVWYRFCKWLPDEIKGKPCNGLFFKFNEDWVLFIHPDRFDAVKQELGPCNLIEYPQERMEEQATLEAMRGLAGPLSNSWIASITKRVRDGAKG